MRRRKDDDLDFLEDEPKGNLLVILGCVAMFLVIIVLCILIWQLLHKDSSAVGKEENAVVQDSILGTESTGSKEEAGGQEEILPGETSENTGDSNQTSSGSGTTPASSGSEDTAVSMTFQEVNETVTAKELTNLRTEPSTARDDTVFAKLKNGETLQRTGINEETGWSRLLYNGQVLYAASRLLTTDLTKKTENTENTTGGNENAAGGQASSESVDKSQSASAGSTGTTQTNGNTVTTKSGRTVTFKPCDDTISPKMEVNLRSEPSTDQGNDTVHYRMAYGETAHRTGIDEDAGWSRIEYNGEIMYVVTSYIFVVENTQGD